MNTIDDVGKTIPTREQLDRLIENAKWASNVAVSIGYRPTFDPEDGTNLYIKWDATLKELGL